MGAERECGSNCCNDEYCPCSKVCDELGYCDKHFEEEKKNYEYLKQVPECFVK